MICYRINSRWRDHPLGRYPDGDAVPKVRRVTDGAGKTADRGAILRRTAPVILALVGLVFLAVGIGPLVSLAWATGSLGLVLIGAAVVLLLRGHRQRPSTGP
jgi:protein-S-isoprenylcysteine O-methyltransferase Ste14